MPAPDLPHAPCGESFPWGTLVVNVIGCFVIGVVAALAAPEGRLFLTANTRLFLMFGICGGFTTFSSFSLQTLNLMRDGAWLWAGANVVLVRCVVRPVHLVGSCRRLPRHALSRRRQALQSGKVAETLRAHHRTPVPPGVGAERPPLSTRGAGAAPGR